MIDMHKELVRELGACKRNFIAIRVSTAKNGGETKSKLVYMTSCTLIFHYFTPEHIPTFRIDLISTVSLKMLKWDAMPQ